MTRLARPLLAVTVGISLLVLTAAPSGATTGTVTGGTATIDLVPGVSIDLSNTTTPCRTGGASLDVTTAGSGFPYSGTATLGTLISFTYQGSNWFLGLGATSSSVVIDTVWWGAKFVSTGPFAPSNLFIFPEDPNHRCGPDWFSPVCTTSSLGSATPALDLIGFFIGTVSPPGLSGTTSLSGSGRISATGCTAPFTALNNATLTFTNMVVVF